MANRQLIIFTLENEEYGVDTMFVQEIIRIPQLIKLPGTPSYVEGIINLRGKVIPVVDLKKKFGFGQSRKSEDSRLIVLNIDGAMAGVMVDDVSEVLRLDESQVEALPVEIMGTNRDCLKNVGRIDERLLLLLDVRKSLLESSSGSY